MHVSSQTAAFALGGVVLGVALSYLLGIGGGSDDDDNGEYSIANQAERHALALKNNNMRVIDINLCYDPSYAKGKTVLITGGNRGIGKAVAEEYIRQGARVFITSRAACSLAGATVISDVDVQRNDCGLKTANALKQMDVKIDILVNNAGYFYEPVETLASLNFEEELKMIDICAIGPLRMTSALYNAHLLHKGARVAIISSQGGSLAWRSVQNPEGHDYGHHMSKAAANMAGVLLAQELQSKGIAVGLLHPGFNKTDMTAKYQTVWAAEGAVSPPTGAKRVVHEIGRVSLKNTGAFVNCEDGKRIPW